MLGFSQSARGRHRVDSRTAATALHTDTATASSVKLNNALVMTPSGNWAVRGGVVIGVLNLNG
jgi:hypothetical protein